jgi:creatinine amidohydrolase
MNYIKYEESRPEAVRGMLARAPIAYLPMGALEWHGEHNPLGLDGLKAYALCERAAERTGGVLFPPVFWGAFDTVPFPFTLRFKRRAARDMIRQTLEQLAQWRFKVIVILTGHYPPSLIKLLRRECRRLNKQGRALAIGVPEQVFAVDLDYYGDHAGMWETSIIMALRPELVNLELLPAGLSALERMKQLGIMGKDPKAHASAEKGQLAVEHIVSGLATVVERSLKEQNDRAIEEVYRNYAQALKIFSPRIRHLIKEALDVHSLGELVRYGLWSLKNLR